MQEHRLPVKQRCALLLVPRSSAYYCPAPATERDGVLTRAMDEIHLRWPFYGRRRMVYALGEEGYAVNQKCAQRLMRPWKRTPCIPGRTRAQFVSVSIARPCHRAG